MNTPESSIAREIAERASLARQAGLSVTCDMARRIVTLARQGVPVPVADDAHHAIIHMVGALRELAPTASLDDMLLYVCDHHLMRNPANGQARHAAGRGDDRPD